MSAAKQQKFYQATAIFSANEDTHPLTITLQEERELIGGGDIRGFGMLNLDASR